VLDDVKPGLSVAPFFNYSLFIPTRPKQITDLQVINVLFAVKEYRKRTISIPTSATITEV